MISKSYLEPRVNIVQAGFLAGCDRMKELAALLSKAGGFVISLYDQDPSLC